MYLFAAFLQNKGWGTSSIYLQAASGISLRRKVPHSQPPYLPSVYVKQLEVTRLSNDCTTWDLQLLKLIVWKGSENWLLVPCSFTRIFPFTLSVSERMYSADPFHAWSARRELKSHWSYKDLPLFLHMLPLVTGTLWWVLCVSSETRMGRKIIKYASLKVVKIHNHYLAITFLLIRK